MKTLRQHYLTEWRVWYSMRYKAHRDGVHLKPEWEVFETWFDEVGERPGDNYQFCRDDSIDNPMTPWNETTSGWREMPLGRKKHRYFPNYARKHSQEKAPTE